MPLPQGIDPSQKWLVLKVSHLGQLQTDKFIKNLILNVNQAINECLVELFVHGQMMELPAVKAVDYLEKLVSHSRIGIASLSSEFIKLIYGDSNDILSTFIQPLVSVFHHELKERTF